MILIKYLPKDQLLLQLWRNAQKFERFQYLHLKLKLRHCREDLAHTYKFMVYYGRTLFIDLSNDYFDPFLYNFYNGVNMAEKVIRKLKRAEINKAILKYYCSF